MYTHFAIVRARWASNKNSKENYIPITQEFALPAHFFYVAFSFCSFDDVDSQSSLTSESSNSDSGVFSNQQKNFRREDGKCMFGALIEKNSSWEKPVTMSTGASGLVSRGLISTIGGSSKFGVWQQDSSCDQLSGTREPTALPPTESMDGFDMLLGIMCRSVRMESHQTVKYSKSVEAKRFAMALSTFQQNATKNQCYDWLNDLPDGIMSVARCCQGSPLAVSLPHFLHADHWWV